MKRPLKVTNAKTLISGNKKVTILYDAYDGAWTLVCFVNGKREPSQDSIEDSEAQALASARKWLQEK